MAEEEKTETEGEAPKNEAPEAKDEAPEVKDEAPAAMDEAPKENAEAEAGDAPPEEPAAKQAQDAAGEEDLPKLTAREIDKMNVPKLKDAALQYKGKIAGVHGMDKSQLIRALKELNGIPLVEPKRASKIDRRAIKDKIKSLRKERDDAIEQKDPVRLKRTRNRVKALRRKLVRNA